MSEKGWTVEECAAAIRSGDDPLTVLRYALAAEKARADAAEAELKSVEAERRREMARNDVRMRSSLREYEEQVKALAAARRECEGLRTHLGKMLAWADLHVHEVASIAAASKEPADAQRARAARAEYDFAEAALAAPAAGDSK